MRRRPLPKAALLLALAVVAAGCHGDKVQSKGCHQDSDCGNPAAAFRCEVTTGVCYCRTNDACPQTQFCNTAGFCQDKSGCETNADCIDPSLFCDTTTGTCLSKGRCTTDLHCPIGQVCDTSRSLCVEGCRSDGDCPGISCRCGDVPCSCTSTDPAQRSACPIGVCDPNFCSDESFCAYGQLCGAPQDGGVGADGGVTDAGVTDGGAAVRNACYSDYDPIHRPYCDNCTFGGGVQTCGSGPNYCLIDTAHPGNYFCGADCSQGQSCPRGYACQDVIVVFSRWACTKSNPACPINPGLPCTQDTDCKRGGFCAKTSDAGTGYCAGVCGIGEGETEGFCSCQVDSDCASETCSGGECSISRQPCVVDGDCHAIHCVDFNGTGGCLIGHNCAPSEGLTCLEVK